MVLTIADIGCKDAVKFLLNKVGIMSVRLFLRQEKFKDLSDAEKLLVLETEIFGFSGSEEDVMLRRDEIMLAGAQYFARGVDTLQRVLNGATGECTLVLSSSGKVNDFSDAVDALYLQFLDCQKKGTEVLSTGLKLDLYKLPIGMVISSDEKEIRIAHFSEDAIPVGFRMPSREDETEVEVEVKSVADVDSGADVSTAGSKSIDVTDSDSDSKTTGDSATGAKDGEVNWEDAV